MKVTITGEHGEVLETLSFCTRDIPSDPDCELIARQIHRAVSRALALQKGFAGMWDSYQNSDFGSDSVSEIERQLIQLSRARHGLRTQAAQACR